MSLECDPSVSAVVIAVDLASKSDLNRMPFAWRVNDGYPMLDTSVMDRSNWSTTAQISRTG